MIISLLLFIAKFTSFPYARLREDHIDCEFQHVFNHTWQDSFQKIARLFQAWIRVDFDQPRVEIFIQDEIVAEKFKAEFSSIWINCPSHSIECFDNDFMHLRHKMAINTRSTFRIVLIDVVLKLREAQLISVFEVTVIGGMLLNSIIRQVHESIVDVLEVNAEFS